MTNLTTKEGRLEALQILNKDCIKTLKRAGIELYEKAIVIVSSNNIEISIMHDDPKSKYYGTSAFASEINIYAKESSKTGLFDRENQISFGTSGSFSPQNKESYWRTIHAASCLKNWDRVCEIVNQFCKEHSELEKEIF